MYYCSNCGAIFYLSRPENSDKPKKPSIERKCLVCKEETRFRKIVPEDFEAPNRFEVEDRLQKLEKE